MSLVAYDASSDEESDFEDNSTTHNVPPPRVISNSKVIVKGDISDEDDFGGELTLEELKKPISSLLGSLPKPKNTEEAQEVAIDSSKEALLSFTQLPIPKSTATTSEVILEEDDEFLHKKCDTLKKEQPPLPQTASSKKAPVKISIPSLKEFVDVDIDKAKSKSSQVDKQSKGCGLLSILPKAKSERNFAKDPSKNASNVFQTEKCTTSTSSAPARPAFIPDTVKNRRSAHNTENVDGMTRSRTLKESKDQKKKVALVNCSESEESDEEGDFFSLNADEKLPEVSLNEVNAMVAKRAAEISQGTKLYLERLENSGRNEEPQVNTAEVAAETYKRHSEQQLQDEAVQALVGSSAKRRRTHQAIEVMDISSSEVLPSRDEWMRTALASSTAFQATGVLVDEEPAAGTRKKHQITYLAHKAKANEAELQAMWAANRMNRRATQSKYGF